ncbi:MAG: ribose ABC transporter permease [Thaumarchaeota archaeon]|nr:ribose ABC transporter permease [Nitrososphaerota archaeon]
MSKRHALGQHFLTSNQVAESIVDLAHITRRDTVLEVGTGKGILTSHLYGKAKRVISVEKDPVLYREAKMRFSGIHNLELEYGDAFEMDVDFTVLVSNLPYSESRNAIEWLVQRKFSHAVIMVQKEFVRKLFLKKGSDRRAVSVLAGYCLDMEQLLDVGKASFQPVPKVDSVVIGMKQKKKVPKELITAVNRLFSFKRKTVRNIARQFDIVIDSDKRLEDLSDGEIIDIAKKIV